MKHVTVLAALAMGLAIAAMTSLLAAPDPAAEQFWAQWRGPYASGMSRFANPPIEWSETKNVRWKLEIPGRGSSSPVVWGDHLFLLTAIPAGIAGSGQHAARGAVNSTGRRSRCSRRTRWTTASMRRRRWSAATCICAVSSISTASRQTDVRLKPDATPAPCRCLRSVRL
jgi:hypothetical protein